MSGNDQPPVPPTPPGSSPDDEPTPVEPPVDLSKDEPPVEAPQGESTPSDPPVEPPQGEPGYVIQPPPPGEFGAQPTPGKNNKGLIIGVAVAAAIIVVGGIVGAIALIANSDGNDDNKKAEAKTSSVEDFCKVIKAMDSSTKTADDPTIVSDALRDAGTPKDMADDEKAGRDLLINIGDDAKDGPAAEKAVTDLNKDDTAKVQAFITYIGKACAPTASETPTP
jgi:hypothetical protein